MKKNNAVKVAMIGLLVTLLLIPGIYYYRAYVLVDNDLPYGVVRSFTTLDGDELSNEGAVKDFTFDEIMTDDVDSVPDIKPQIKQGHGSYTATKTDDVRYETNDNPTVNDKKVTANEVNDGNDFATIHDANGYEYVDLGLSVVWATCNVGAANPEDCGEYYAWGETVTKSSYDWSTYEYCSGSYNTLTKYCCDSSYGYNGFTDTKTILDPEDDVAHVKWGGDWRLPTQEEFIELTSCCTCIWTTINGVKGYKLTSKMTGYTDCSIFLPAAGYRGNNSLYSVGSYGYYWSGSFSPDSPFRSCLLYFYTDDYFTYSGSRYSGRSVRPVCP